MAGHAGGPNPNRNPHHRIQAGRSKLRSDGTNHYRHGAEKMKPATSRFSVNMPATLRKQTQAVARKMAVPESTVVKLAVHDYVNRLKKPSDQAATPGMATT